MNIMWRAILLSLFIALSITYNLFPESFDNTAHPALVMFIRMISLFFSVALTVVFVNYVLDELKSLKRG